LEKNNPINKAINPEQMVNTTMAIQPNCPKMILHTKAITITLALQATNGAISMEIIFSFLELVLRAIIMAGTLQPNPVNKLTILRPLIPNFSNVLSNRTDTLDKIPTWLIIFTKKNKITITGTNDKTAKKPFKIPSTNILAIHWAPPPAFPYKPWIFWIINLSNKLSASNVCNPPPVQGPKAMK
jgi:hypothetical protein